MSWDGSNYSSSGSEAVDANALDPFYTGLITTTRAATRDDMRILDIATEDCFGFLRKNFFDNGVSLQQYTISTGEESPRDLLTFCFDEDSHGKRAALGHNTVMEQLFRDIFIHKGSNPFEHGAFGTFVTYYLHDEEGCPGASMHQPLDMSALVCRLQIQASLEWHGRQGCFGAVNISVPPDDDLSD